MGNPARVFLRDPSYDGQLARSMSAAYAGAADLGEVLAAARAVGGLSGDNWYEAWNATADRARATADSAVVAGEWVTARAAYLRAGEYYRQACYFIRSDPSDARMLQAWSDHVAAYTAAFARLDAGPELVERVDVPYDGTTLKAWFFAPDDDRRPRATLLTPAGYDSTAEAGWVDVPDALARGYNVVSFEGPGQGEALYVKKLYFRPDFEHVLGQVVDWFSRRSDVDASRIGLVGRSFGGYLAPRGATAEHRIAALVCDPAQPDMGAKVPAPGRASAVAERVVNGQMRFSKDRSEFFRARMSAHGISDVGQYFEVLRTFTMIDKAAEITCPTLIVESDNDFAGGAGQILYDRLRCPKRIIRLTAAEGADGHCAGLGQQVWAAAVYSWLDGVLTPSRVD